MPIYAYKCGACGKAHDALQKISDAPLLTCPHCGADALAKQVTAAGFQLKGSGWYVTDFRDGGGKKADKAAESAEGSSKSEASSDGKADPKSDGKSDSKAAASQAPAPAAPSPAPASAPASANNG